MRLGDLDALKTILFNDTQYCFWHDSVDGSDVAYTQRDLFKCIDAIPTIDAVSVVRCSECVLSGSCTQEDIFRLVAGIENPFCCVGKRKDGEG